MSTRVRLEEGSNRSRRTARSNFRAAIRRLIVLVAWLLTLVPVAVIVPATAASSEETPNAAVHLHPVLRLCPAGGECRPLPDGVKVSFTYQVVEGDRCTTDMKNSEYVTPDIGEKGDVFVFKTTLSGSCAFLSSRAQYLIRVTFHNGASVDLLVNIDQHTPNIFQWKFTVDCGHNTQPAAMRCEDGEKTQAKNQSGVNNVSIPFNMIFTGR